MVICIVSVSLYSATHRATSISNQRCMCVRMCVNVCMHRICPITMKAYQIE